MIPYSEPKPLLFVKDDCPRCERVKELTKDCDKVTIVNISSIEGMTEACFYNIYYETMPVCIDFHEGDSYVLKSVEDIVNCIIGYDALVKYDESPCSDDSCRV